MTMRVHTMALEYGEILDGNRLQYLHGATYSTQATSAMTCEDKGK